jgi:D,D-heptose 1,7-bisphosphate phosphatase
MRTATLRQCVIQLGSGGASLDSLTGATPNPLQFCGDRSFLAWKLRELSRFGFEEALLLSGRISDGLRDAVLALAAGLPRPMRIVFSQEPPGAGTGGALHHAHGLLDERFLLCDSDSLLDCNLADLLAQSRLDDESVIGRVLVLPGDINAGIGIFDRRIHAFLQPDCSLEQDVIPALTASGRLLAQLACGHFIDVGIPADLARAQTELPALLHRRALFLDRDGVINVDHGYVGTPDRFEFVAGARRAITLATRVGWHVFIVTNQSGVARGFYDEAAVVRLHAWVAEQVRQEGGTIDDVRYCPHHPDGTVAEYRSVSDWRKPAPGMLLGGDLAEFIAPKLRARDATISLGGRVA